MTKSTQRAPRASKSKSATIPRAKKTSGGESPKAADGLFVKTDVTPEQFFQAWSRKEREVLIDLLIDSLDEADGDPDLEDTADDEPSLGSVAALSPYNPYFNQEHWAASGMDDREGDDSDDEPSIGGDDLELDHSDYEPNLGWTENGAIAATRQGDACGECEGEIYCGRGQDIEKAKKRRRKPRTIRTELAFGGRGARRVLNLTDRQRDLMAPRIDRDSHVRMAQ